MVKKTVGLFFVSMWMRHNIDRWFTRWMGGYILEEDMIHLPQVMVLVYTHNI